MSRSQEKVDYDSMNIIFWKVNTSISILFLMFKVRNKNRFEWFYYVKLYFLDEFNILSKSKSWLINFYLIVITFECQKLLSLISKTYNELSFHSSKFYCASSYFCNWQYEYLMLQWQPQLQRLWRYFPRPQHGQQQWDQVSS